MATDAIVEPAKSACGFRRLRARTCVCVCVCVVDREDLPMRFEHKARLPVANRGVKTRILVPVSWSHMTCIARIGRADVKRRFTNEYGPKRRAAGSSRPGESGCLHNRSASRPVPRRTGKQTIAQNQMKKSVFFKSSWTLPKLARSPDERLLPVCTTSLSRPLRGSLHRDRARFQRPHRGYSIAHTSFAHAEPDPDRLRRCRARVQCVSNSSACAGSEPSADDPALELRRSARGGERGRMGRLAEPLK